MNFDFGIIVVDQKVDDRQSSSVFFRINATRIRNMKIGQVIGFILLSFAFSSINAQNLSGRWKGTLTQEGKEAKFTYSIDLQQNGTAISGAAESVSPDGKQKAKFTISGVVQGGQLILQEIKQLLPKDQKWCLKYMVFKRNSTEELSILNGNWTADGCTPGTIMLKRELEEAFIEREVPFTFTGKWTGYLSQSDRDYGFYFEAAFQEEAKGQSYIVSEDNGGSAHHRLNWTVEPEQQKITFTEQFIEEKTDSKWKWCIKSANLNFRKEKSRYVLEGEWKGYIEGYDLKTGACASGKIYLEKPILSEKIRKATQKMEAYTSESARKVKVARVLEVNSPKLKIRVWDNGTVDGDYVTLFLNGKQILNNYRVTKRKRMIPVELNMETNFLILHAEDLGDISPNTVAVSIHDGIKEQIIILSSNLEESGAVMIRQFRLD